MTLSELFQQDGAENLKDIFKRVKHLETLQDSGGGNVGTVDLSQFGWDAAGRSRVSLVTTLGDYKLLYDKNALLYDEEVNGTGTSTYNSSKTAVTLATAASGDFAIRQTKQWHNYQSGKSHFVEFTFQDLTAQTNVTKRAGYFSTSTASPWTANRDGVYLESSGGSVVLKVDKDGSNVYTGSNITGVDWSKFTIAILDFLWLGGSTVRLWLIQNGKITLADSYNHAGNTADVMMLSPNQPIRYEIRQDGAGSGTLDTICSQVASEGSQNEIGTTVAIDNATTSVTATTAGTIYALKGYRLQSARRGVVTEVESLSIQNTNNNRNFRYVLLLNPSVAGTFTYANVTNSSIQEATGVTANTATGGFQLWSGYGGDGAALNTAVKTALKVGSKIDGTMDELVLCVQGLQNNQDFVGALNILEFI